MLKQKLSAFIQLVIESLEGDTFIGLALMNKKDKESDLKSIKGKVISTKKGEKLSLLYRHKTKDITKNYTFDEASGIIKEGLENKFFQAELSTTKKDYYFAITGLNIVKIKETEPKSTNLPEKSHDKQKKRLVKQENANYLQELGVFGQNGKVKSDKQDKFKQINKFIEIIDGLVKANFKEDSISVLDMGSGKGYLTFALYDYLKDKFKTNVKGIEMRQDMVDKCNAIAQQSNFNELSFELGNIQDFEVDRVNLLIA